MYEMISLLSGAIIAWIISHLYYKKTIASQNEQIKNLHNEINKISNDLQDHSKYDELTLREQRLNQLVDICKKSSSQVSEIINTYPDIDNNNKFAMYNTTFLRAKGKIPKNNPFKKSGN